MKNSLFHLWLRLVLWDIVFLYPVVWLVSLAGWRLSNSVLLPACGLGLIIGTAEFSVKRKAYRPAERAMPSPTLTPILAMLVKGRQPTRRDAFKWLAVIAAGNLLVCVNVGGWIYWLFGTPIATLVQYGVVYVLLWEVVVAAGFARESRRAAPPDETQS